MSITAIARPEIRALQCYEVAAPDDGAIRLNANEAAMAIGQGATDGLNRYPGLRPLELTARLAGHYGVSQENVLVTRGSSEGIDLLVRTFCQHGLDSVVVTPPVFALYEIYASVQGARTLEVPLRADRDFALDIEALLSVCEPRTKLVFLCSPNNPVGSLVPREQILQIVQARSAKSVVVVDEAYIEYSGEDSLAPLVSEFDNLVVLRTMSKALALAGARCGAVIAAPGVIRLLDSILAPYAVSAPVARSADSALSRSRLAEARTQVRITIDERERLRVELAACKAVERIWPSNANFLLVRFYDLAALEKHLTSRGIAIRTYANDEILRGCARITVAAPGDNNRLIRAIREFG